MESRAREITVLTLPEWMHKYFDFMAEQPTNDGPAPRLLAARFALSGLDRSEDTITTINTATAKVRSTGPEPYIRRDYDSLIGYTTRYPVTRNIAFHTLPNVERSLKGIVRVKHPFHVRNVSTGLLNSENIDPGKVPNIIFGTFGERGSVRIHFPGLFERNTRGTPEVSREKRAQFYNDVIRPAGELVIPHAILDWPTTYESGEFKDRKAKQGFKNSTVLISGPNAQLLCNCMREIINDCEETLAWAKHFVWGIEVRGIKDTCFHEVGDADFMVDEAMDVATDGLEIRRGATWYMDVGLEYITPGRALLWSVDQHVAILTSTLGVSVADANRIICRRGTSYVKDPSSHLFSLSGFRTTTGIYGGDFDAVYVQAYTTDKAQTYHPDGTNFGKAITPRQAMNGTPPQFCVALQNTYHHAKSNVDVATRLEVRVPLEKAKEVLRSPPVTLWHGMVSYERSLWWSYRQIKLVAATNMITELNTLTKERRVKEHNLTFILAMVYMINSIHSRPDDSSLARKLNLAIMPITLDEMAANILNPNQNQVADSNPYAGRPYAPGGVIYIRPFFLKPEAGEIRFMSRTVIDEVAFRGYWGGQPHEIREMLWPTKKVQQWMGKRITSRKGKTRVIQQEGAEAPLIEFENFNTIPVAQEPTIEEELLDIVADPLAPPRTLADLLSSIYKQFLTDIIQKIPGTNIKKNPDALTTQYCPLNQADRSLITVDDFNNGNDFTKLFVCLQYKYATTTEWALAVDALLPAKGTLAPQDLRHYQTCAYWTAWKDLMEELPGDDALDARRALTQMVFTLPWLPAAHPTRLWRTDAGSNSDKYTFIPPSMYRGKATAPRILLGQKAPMTVPFIRDALEEQHQAYIAQLRQEEEEDSE